MGSIAPFTGGCVCGAIRYECTAEPIAMLNCHCRTCQKVTGGAYVPVVFIPSEAFKLTGLGTCCAITFTERVKKASGTNEVFAADCGSRITGKESETPSSHMGLMRVQLG